MMINKTGELKTRKVFSPGDARRWQSKKRRKPSQLEILPFPPLQGVTKAVGCIALVKN